jgi:hypothetical protein
MSKSAEGRDGGLVMHTKMVKYERVISVSGVLPSTSPGSNTKHQVTGSPSFRTFEYGSEPDDLSTASIELTVTSSVKSVILTCAEPQ